MLRNRGVFNAANRPHVDVLIWPIDGDALLLLLHGQACFLFSVSLLTFFFPTLVEMEPKPKYFVSGSTREVVAY